MDTPVAAIVGRGLFLGWLEEYRLGMGRTVVFTWGSISFVATLLYMIPYTTRLSTY